MAKTPPFEMQDGHKYFSAYCFNKTWDFIEKPARTEQENQAMLQTCFASLWHWSQREDITPKNRSVGYWQASRVLALIGKPDDARAYGLMSLENSEGLEPFYIGYAYEALARSEMVAGDAAKMNEYLSAARQQCDSVTDAENKKLLEDDLKTIGL